MDATKKLMVSLAGWVEQFEENIEALEEMIIFIPGWELKDALPEIVEYAYGNPLCFVVTEKDGEHLATIFGADKSKFDNFALQKLHGIDGIKMIGQGARRPLDTSFEASRLSYFLECPWLEKVESDDAPERAEKLARDIAAADDSHAFLLMDEGFPVAGIFKFHQEDLVNFIFSWHPEWVERMKAREEESDAGGEAGGQFFLPSFRVKNLCSLISYVEDEEEREEAVRLLEGMGDEAVGLLIEALDDDDESVQAGAALALGELGVADAIDGITEMIFKEQKLFIGNVDTRVSGFRALVSMGEAAVDPLVGLLGHPDGDIRGLAAWALGKAGAERALQPVLDLLDDREGFVRRDAATALGRLKDQSAVGPLIKALDDGDAEVRWAAAISLKKLGDRRVLKNLKPLLEDDDAKVREGAREAIEHLSREVS